MGLSSVGSSGGRQPVAEIFTNSLYVQNSSNIKTGRATAYTGNFDESGSTLICNTSGTYHVNAYGSFRYGQLHLQVNGKTEITVDGFLNPGGEFSDAEGDIILNAGDTVSFVHQYLNEHDTRIASGNAIIYRKG